MAHEPAEVADRPESAEPGVYLFVHVTWESVELYKAARVERAPRANLRAPRLNKETAPQFEKSASELVLAVIRDDGGVVESFGWTAEPEAFVDGPEAERVHPSLRLREWDARWRIPTTDAVRYLQFYRTDLTKPHGGASTLTQKSLGVFDLKPGGPEPPWPFPVPKPEPPIPVPLPPRNVLKASKWQLSWYRGKIRAASILQTGYIKKSEVLVDNGDPSTKFNVVILGDGFQDGELAKFDDYAALAKEALTTTLPFSTVANRINVYKVTVVSNDSGITNCPTCGAAPKQTYFNTTGCWGGSTSPTFINTAWTWRIMDAVETVIPQEDAHLILTIINVDIYGGSSPPETELAFVTLPRTHSIFKKVTTHESAHAFANLNEEYNPCNVKDPLRDYPNETTQTDLAAGTVWWKILAQPGELLPSGDFAVIHRQGDPVDLKCQPSNLTPAGYKRLGAFWGCHNGEPLSPGMAPAASCDPRGKNFFRGMTECRMRGVLSEFCRVCSHLITEFIMSVST